MTTARDTAIAALIDDAWEGHADPLTRDDLGSIVDRVLDALAQRTRAAPDAKVTLDHVRRLLDTLPILAAASDKEPWLKVRNIDLAKVIDVAAGEDPDEWVHEPCDRGFGHSPHHWTELTGDMAFPVRMPHYCNGEV